ncbi:transposase [Desulfobacula sp.]|uniref:transposase n=1 Tax=Desulfobacula sp. TaxID=2593537 RepID=UPI0039B8ADC3
MTTSIKSKKEKAEIHWGDETGLCNDSYYGRSYAPRGETPAIKIHPRCQRVNLISTVTNQGKVRFMIYKDKMNSQTLIRFMKRLIKDFDQKLFLILDNLRVHHSHIFNCRSNI